MVEQNTISASSKEKNRIRRKGLAWTWQLATNEFQIDQNALKIACEIEKDIKTIEDFVLLFSQQDKETLVNLLKSAHEGNSPSPVKVSLGHNEFAMTACIVSATMLNKDVAAGYLQFLNVLPPQEELSSIASQFFENARHGLLVTDQDTKIITCNAYFENSSGYKLSELVGQKTNIFNAKKHSSEFFDHFWHKLSNENYWSGLILSRTKSNKIIPQELSIQRIVTRSKNVYYVGMTKNLSKKLYRLAGKEHGGIELLTQLPSDSDYKEKVKQMFDNLPQNNGLMVLCFSPELDVAIEHEVRKKIASALSSLPDNFTTAGYLGGNAFSICIYYKRSASRPHSLSIYETIKAVFHLIRSEVDNDIYDVLSRSTIGTSVVGLDSNGSATLVSHALQAMYEKHSHNNNNICFYNRALHDKVKKRETLEQLTIECIKNSNVEVFFQPIISSENWQIKKFEALCRFRDTEGNILDTQKIIKIAEDLNMISELDLVMAEKSISSRQLLAEIFGKNVEITINISLASSKPLKKLFADLCLILDKYSEEIPFITIELTESSYFNSEDTDADLLFELRTKGVQIAIDDFGTGYSSFAYLKDGNFDLLKIDREFVNGITVGSHNYYIAKMITNLAHTLGVQVVAEGVETLQEIVILKELKVDLLQGFYFSKPKPVEELTPYSGYAKKLSDLQGSCSSDTSELFIYPPTLSAENNLAEVKEIFDNTNYIALPVINDKTCVGFVSKEIFNFHSSPSVGTDTETAQDYRLLSKPVSAMMHSRITRVHRTINSGEIHEKIRNNYSFPWIVIDDDGHYVAIIDNNSIISYLNDL